MFRVLTKRFNAFFSKKLRIKFICRVTHWAQLVCVLKVLLVIEKKFFWVQALYRQPSVCFYFPANSSKSTGIGHEKDRAYFLFFFFTQVLAYCEKLNCIKQQKCIKAFYDMLSTMSLTGETCSTKVFHLYLNRFTNLWSFPCRATYTHIATGNSYNLSYRLSHRG